MPESNIQTLHPHRQMQCMEVWGGNRFTDSDFEMPGLRVWLYSKPHGLSAGGGDVYYLSSCASGRITRMLLADVSGHGDSVAETAVRLRSLMRQNINRIHQSRLVERMNERFSEVADRGNAFATAIVSTFFAPTKTLTMCFAGHPRPLIYRHKTRAWSTFTTPDQGTAGLSDLPLGVINRVRYSEFSLPLERGDRVLVYTDGLSEARDQSGQLLGTEGLRSLASAMETSEPGRFLPALLQRIGEMSEQGLDCDDVTAILIEATESPVPMMNNLLAPVRLVKSLLGNPPDPVE